MWSQFLQLKCVLAICLAAMLTAVGSVGYAADDRLVVVVHPDNNLQITREDLYRLYFGKRSSLPPDTQLTPVLNVGDKDLLHNFSNLMLQRSTRQLRSYWARQLFTGKGTPPVRVKSAVDLKELIAGNPKFIGYLWESDLDSSVRVLLSATQ